VEQVSMAKISNNISFRSRVTIITRDGIHKIQGKEVSLSLLPSGFSNCHSFVSICADTDNAIKVNPWHPTEKSKSFVSARYLNLYMKTKAQTEAILKVFKDTMTVSKRNYVINHDEKNGLLDIRECYLMDGM
jgi:hypothetical protein